VIKRPRFSACSNKLYEEKIQHMGHLGRNGGEYYTPRPLIRAMNQVTRPKIPILPMRG
jgi:hypothetical protein